jgi:hypothetical protein
MASLPISDKGYHSKAPSTYTSRKIGSPYTLEHRIFIEKDGVPVSPFHDIPLYANEQQTILNMIVEVPRWTNAKMEVCTLQKPVSEEIGLCFFFLFPADAEFLYRFVKRKLSTLSSKTSRRASSDM